VEVLARGKENCALVAQINVHARFILQLMNELRIHASAGAGERLKDPRSLEGKIGKHTGGGVRCFPPRLSTFHQEDSGASLPQRDRHAESDDPASDDDDVPGFHFVIVKEAGQATYSLAR
jgi:hypothetical protein